MKNWIKPAARITAVSIALLAFAGCANMSKHVAKDGSGADELVWRDIQKVTPMHKHKDVYGTWPNKANLEQIEAGMSKGQIMALIGEPHYSEGIGPREWNYVFNFRRPETNEHYVCQYKILFDTDKFAQSFYWHPENCMNPPEPEHHIENVTLEADALFAFDQDTIKPEGKQRLDDFAQTILDHDGIVNSLTISGYTDRFGSETYNRDLSQRRADAVRDYLANQGIPDDAMRAVGMGENDPVVHCDGQTATSDVIQCLQPNRRVEIEVDISDKS